MPIRVAKVQQNSEKRYDFSKIIAHRSFFLDVFMCKYATSALQ